MHLTRPITHWGIQGAQTSAPIAAPGKYTVRLTAELTNRIEVVRRQIEDQLKANRGKDDIEKALADFDRKRLDVELQLITRSDMQSHDKYYPEQYNVYMNLIWFNGGIGSGAGDVSGGAEYRPTNAAGDVPAEIERDLAAAKSAFDRVMSTDLPAFNQAMGGKIPEIK